MKGMTMGIFCSCDEIKKDLNDMRDHISRSLTIQRVDFEKLLSEQTNIISKLKNELSELKNRKTEAPKQITTTQVKK